MFINILKSIVICFLIISISISCTQNNNTIYNNKLPGPTVLNSDSSINVFSNYIAVIETIHGNVEFKFYTSLAPKTTAYIISLIKEKHFDGSKISRILPHYIVQFGSNNIMTLPKGSLPPKAEFNNLQHIAGAIAIVHTNKHQYLNNVEFYITLSTQPQLDGKFTIFGQVINGLENLNKLKGDDKIISLSIKDQN